MNEKMTMRHRVAESVKAAGPVRDLTNPALTSTLTWLRSELRRSYPTSYYRNWFLLWEVVQLKIQPLEREFCFPGAYDPASIIEDNDRVLSAARDPRATTSHEYCPYGMLWSIPEESPGYERSWTQPNHNWAQLKVA